MELLWSEYGWWETATVLEVDRRTEEIVLATEQSYDSSSSDDDQDEDEDDDLILMTKGDASSLRRSMTQCTGYHTKCHVDDFELAESGRYTLPMSNLAFPLDCYVMKEEVSTVWMSNGTQRIVVGTDSMQPDSVSVETPHPGTRRRDTMMYCMETNKWASWRDIDWRLDKNVLFEGEKQCLSVIGSVSQTLFANQNYQCKDINKVYVDKFNELHLLVEIDSQVESQYLIIFFRDEKRLKFRLCFKYRTNEHCRLQIVHCRLNLNAMRIDFLPSLSLKGEYDFEDGQMVYVVSMSRLMYFGGARFDGECLSHSIWIYDLEKSKRDSNTQWRLFPLTLPRNEHGEFTVVAAGEIVFVFYFDESRKIYLYDLVAQRAYKLTKEYPCPFRGKSVAVKTASDHIHFMNACECMDDLQVRRRPYHFAVKIEDLIPIKVRETMRQRHGKLIHGYVATMGMSASLNRYLQGIIEAFYPVFL